MSETPPAWGLNPLWRVVQEVRRRGVTTRGDITAATGISTQSLSSHVDRLVEQEMLHDDGARIAGSRFPRPRQPVSLHRAVGFMVSIDFGRDRTYVAIADAEYHVCGEAFDVQTGTEAAPDEALALIAEAVVKRLDAYRIPTERLIGVGAGLPGPVRRPDGVPESRSIIPRWAGSQVPTLLQQAFARAGRPGIRSVATNDASLGALGVFTRQRFSDPVDAPQDLIYVRLTSGIGAGLVVKGHLVTGADGFAGELGHLRVRSGGPLCPGCGSRGCLETLASEPAVVHEVCRAAGIEESDTDALQAVLASDHPAMAHALWEAGWSTGFALSQAVTVLNPRVVILGGAFTKNIHFLDAVRHGIERNALQESVKDLAIQTWGDMPPSSEGRRPRRDIGIGLTPELLGGLAVTIDELADDYLRPRVEALYREIPRVAST